MFNRVKMLSVLGVVFAVVYASHLYRAIDARERAVRSVTSAPVVLTPEQEDAAQRIAADLAPPRAVAVRD